MEPARDIDRLLEIMARLRDPDTGCPWDVEQTFATIAPYTIEEAYEVADAIERDDMLDLVDELGDLLLQVVFHARMAEEAGTFDFGAVVEAITRKMIRRHPHVFGDETVRGEKLAKGMWEKIKAAEKAERAEAHRAAGLANSDDSARSLLDDVPRALPALMRALKLQKRAANVGFDWDTAPPILAKIREETDELAEVMDEADPDRVREEYGDLLFAMVNLGRHLDVEPEAALTEANAKFVRRFKRIEDELAARGSSPEAADLAEMDAIWNAVKRAEKQG
ncbi:MAG: nucleoside triphosphate pyrophosphohydrolase [Roseitalea sp.]|jgi:ATP diphosphatase|nr:nucleoside triphosphate pyrophosphohydrolase [Roseitalea sp.]MBO6722351.1 nucleoside triphosphate pyrophosphohydrolase [Roseitalea sp.]MBO6744354.1 nucleoside triphosphate pyrophosphohydrolase [Roseitalea sp.]